MKTLVVNLFAGPGSGKSTLRAGIFYNLKLLGVECEEASEFAKDLVWEHREYTFTDQIYLFAKQYHRIHRLLGQVQVIITDCPILLTPIYDALKRETLKQLALEEHRKMWTYNAFIHRIKPYNTTGRRNSSSDARAIDVKIADLLSDNNISYELFEGNDDGRRAIVNKILLLLNYDKKK